jgi:hypothetical protein
MYVISRYVHSSYYYNRILPIRYEPTGRTIINILRLGLRSYNPTVPVRIKYIVDKYIHNCSLVIPLRSISHPVHTHQEVYVPNPTVPVRIIYIVDKCIHDYLLVLPLRSISHPPSRSTYITQPYRYV